MAKEERPHFQQQLKGLDEDFQDLSNLVVEAFEQAVYALKTGNAYQAERVIQRDKFINARRYELEDSVLHLLTLQQPVVARDLRLAASMIIFASELERMGDYAKGIAFISQELHQEQKLSQPELEIIQQLEVLSEIGLKMLRQAVEAFVKRDVETARQIALQDDELDRGYNQVNLAIVKFLIKNPKCQNRGMRLNWAAHNIERLGDRVVNICERIVFIETGQLADF